MVVSPTLSPGPISLYSSRPPAGSVRQILEAARLRHPELERVLAVATILHDGRVVRAADEVAAGDEVEVLPPFAGG